MRLWCIHKLARLETVPTYGCVEDTYFTASRVLSVGRSAPRSELCVQLLHCDGAQINFLEVLAVILFVATLGSPLSGKVFFCFIGNNGVFGSLMKRSCRPPETN